MSTVTFYDGYVPSVKDAEYTVTVGQQLTIDVAQTTADGGTTTIADPPASLTQKFIVRGPRVVIDPADVQRAFPPPGASGAYDKYLPMLVLRRRTLPWERELELDNTQCPPGTTREQFPWVALLVFSEDELLIPGGGTPPPPGSQRSPTRALAVPLGEAVNGTFQGEATTGPPPRTLAPTMRLEDDEDPAQTICNVIELDVATFVAIAPGISDQRLLTHVRDVVSDGKARPQSDGWFATIVANRLAISPSTASSPPRRNVVHLVSLEGLESCLGADGPAVSTADFDRVRLISLYAWSYSCQSDPAENFRELSLNLISPQSDAGSGLLLRVPPPGPLAPWADAAHVLAAARIAEGYVALPSATQSGEQTFAWYRGPLAAAPSTEAFANAPDSGPQNRLAPCTASEAMVYDSENGVLDHSYAVAFQTGRSLALASSAFATALLHFRRTTHGLVDQLMELMRSPLMAASLQSEGILDSSGQLTASGIDDLTRLLGSNLVPGALVSALSSEMTNALAQQIGRAGGFGDDDQELSAGAVRRGAVRAAATIPSDLAALMGDPAVQQLIAQVTGLQVTGSGGTATFEPAAELDLLVQWLAQTALLHGVSFEQLVADKRMLPVESIRFFYVDPNWIDALLDGALSAGIQSSRDSLLGELLRDPLHAAVDAELTQVRDRLRGATATKAEPAPRSMAGFVLRSALVSGWPGLEVRAWSGADREDPMEPLRLDRISPTALIAIYPDIPVRVELNEPPEGLVFGYEDEGISPRYLPGTSGETPQNVGQVISPENPAWFTPQQILALRRSPSPLDQPPLKIGALAAALAANLPGGPAAFGPAEFAVQMVRVPEQMRFDAPTEATP